MAMHSDNETDSELTTKTFMDAMIRIGLIVFLAILCFRVFSPFVAILLGGLILSIILYPLHQRLTKRLGGRQGRASILLVVVGCVLLGVPLWMLGNSSARHIRHVHTAFENDELIVMQPDPRVAEWPLIGEKFYRAWSDAVTNLPKYVEMYRVQIREITRWTVSTAGNAFGSLFMFLGTFILAGIMMAWGKPGSNAMQRVLCRVAGPVKGAELWALSVATVRSVAAGVLGVAFIQALLFGIGFILAGVPAAGVLALIVLLICILQLPAVIVAVPVIICVWSVGDASVLANIFYTLYFLFAGLCDNVLKPLLLGRGVDAPMPVILIGALGGMVSGGFIGLFLGAILLAIGYQVFMDWVEDAEDRRAADPA